MKKRVEQKKIQLPKIGISTPRDQPFIIQSHTQKNVQKSHKLFNQNNNSSISTKSISHLVPDKLFASNYQKSYRSNNMRNQSLKSIHSNNNSRISSMHSNNARSLGGIDQFLHQGERSLNLFEALREGQRYGGIQTEQQEESSGNNNSILNLKNVTNLHIKRLDINSQNQQNRGGVFSLTALEKKNKTSYKLPNGPLLNLCNLKKLDQNIQSQVQQKKIREEQNLQKQRLQDQTRQNGLQTFDQLINKDNNSLLEELNQEDLQQNLEEKDKSITENDKSINENEKNEKDKNNIEQQQKKGEDNNTQKFLNTHFSNSKIQATQRTESNKESIQKSQFQFRQGQEITQGFKLDDLIDDLISFNNTQNEFLKFQNELKNQRENTAEFQNLLLSGDEELQNNNNNNINIKQNSEEYDEEDDDEGILSFTRDDKKDILKNNDNNSNDISKDFQQLQEQKQANIDAEFEKRFEKVVQIRADDMVYNVKQLLRLQKIREQKIYQNLIQPEEMMEYIRKRNQIQILLENSRNIKNLKNIAGLIESEISQQNTKINGIVDILLKKFQLEEYQNKN